MNPGDKPPIGLCPESVYKAECNRGRIRDILAAIRRYSEAKVFVPVGWVDELTSRVTEELNSRLQP